MVMCRLVERVGVDGGEAALNAATRLFMVVLVSKMASASVSVQAQESTLSMPMPPLPPDLSSAPDHALPESPVLHSVLGLTDLERIALEENPTIAQATAKLQESRARAYQAGLHPNPVLVYDAGGLGAEGTPGLHGAFMDHPIITNGKLRTNRARFEVEVEQGQWRLLHQRYRLLNGVRLRFFRILALQWTIDIQQEMLATAGRVLELTERMIDEGHAEEPARNRARIHLSKTRLALNQSHLHYQQTWRELAAFLGRPEMKPVPLLGKLDHQSPVPEFEACLERLFQESPGLKVVELYVQRARHTVDYEERIPFPDWIVRGGVEYDHTINQPLPFYRFTTQFPIWDRNRGNIAMARNDLRDNRINVERYKLELQFDLAQIYYPYQLAIQTAREFRDEIIPNAHQAFEEYLELFLAEEQSYSRVEGMEVELFESKLQYVDTLRQAREAEVMIHGLLIAGTLEEPEGTPTGARPTRMPVGP